MSFWGWGFEDQFPDRDGRQQLGQLVKLQLGVDVALLDAPTIEQIELPSARRSAPADLPVVADDEQRIRHTYGRAYGDLVRAFSRDFSSAPDLVGLPTSQEEVAQILAWCDENQVAVVPFGGGTSVVRGVECPRDRAEAILSLDLRGVGRVLEVDETSMLARIEAGALGPQLEADLKTRGLTLRHYPQSFEFSTLGGWIATRAGGHFATLYTHIDELVASTKMIAPSGEVHTRTLPGSGAGPSPDRLVLGSEGTLGVITEAVMRVRRRPTHRASASFTFERFEQGVEAARLLAQSGLYPTNCRLLDPTEATLNGVTADGQTVLIVAFESADHPLETWMQRALEIAQGAGGTTSGPKYRSAAGENWKNAFIQAPYLQTQLVSMGVLADTFETACTWSAFPALHEAIVENVTAALIRTGGFGRLSCRFTHVYPDGPAPYYTFVTQAKPGGELEQWAEIKQAASDTLIAQGGTITHHHAVGRTHRPWYEQQAPLPYREALRGAKASLDPRGIMNPGVLIDPR